MASAGFNPLGVSLGSGGSFGGGSPGFSFGGGGRDFAQGDEQFNTGGGGANPWLTAAGILTGGALGGVGQLLASLLTGGTGGSGDIVTPIFTPGADPLIAGTAFSAADLLGVGDVSTLPGPIEQLIGEIKATGIDAKNKRRGLETIRFIRESGIRDKEALEKAGVPFGKPFNAVLSGTGRTIDDFFDILDRDEEFIKSRDVLAEQSKGLNESTILNRMRTAQTASDLLGAAAGFADTGQPQTPLQEQLLSRINRGITDQESQLLLRSNFGGFQPGAGLDLIQRAREDAPLTAIEQALAVAAGLTEGLGGGLELAQTSANTQVNAGLGAAQIASNQAIAANNIRAQSELADKTNLAEGITGLFGSVGTGLSTAALSFDKAQRAPGSTTSNQFFSRP